MLHYIYMPKCDLCGEEKADVRSYMEGMAVKTRKVITLDCGIFTHGGDN